MGHRKIGSAFLSSNGSRNYRGLRWIHPIYSQFHIEIAQLRVLRIRSIVDFVPFGHGRVGISSADQWCNGEEIF